MHMKTRTLLSLLLSFALLFSVVGASAASAAPAAPTGLTAAADGERGIRLSWTGSADAAAYRIYRYSSANKDYVPIGETDAETYFDGTVYAGYTYYYKVSAVATNGDPAPESSLSRAAGAPAVRTPAAPAGLTAVGEEAGIRLSWEESRFATVYRVYRYSSLKKDYVLLDETPTPDYFDTTARAGYTYYYKVKAVFENGLCILESGFTRAAGAARIEPEPTTEPVTEHTHTLVAVPAKAPTETEDGHYAYWHCEECGKYFEDEAGKLEVTKSDLRIPYLNSPERCSYCGEVHTGLIGMIVHIIHIILRLFQSISE